MGSVNGNDQSNWASYSNDMDCSQGICNIYCTRFCYWLLPPAPAPPEYDEDPTPFPPLVIGVIGVLATVFLLVGCYTIVSRYCKRRPSHAEGEGIEGTAGGRSGGGLDESLIRAIAVCEYRNGDGRVRGGECAVCLGRFQERVALRLLPRCGHAFHLGCIDEWLRSHPSCPLCRADVDPRRARPASDDLVLTVDGASGGGDIETRDEEAGNGRFRRSVSLGDFPGERLWWVSTTGVEGGEDESSSARRQVEMKRSASTGGTGGQVMCTVHEGSKIFVLPR